MITYKKRIPIYYGELIIIFNDNFDESLKKANIVLEKKITGYSALSIPTINKKTNVSKYVIIFKREPSNSDIVHEALHITNWILNDRGVEVTANNDEAQCYLLGYIVKEIYDFLKKYD
jgi:hypothetical protein